ncbi:hypothetical protein SAPIO_CDS9734 [Scedosporium apiospermum]|uniref:cellulase n=1 Tax=Pseudallescheria apiosperma TaxID=563466 RepID=A0A084FXF9_PSEDA|nr:uncharacterized protein SAPIO_CDS9734 [Scedosporium apiospermum]KEZ39771.1 hypothetical protein SAPIO_CDS9734 [Scedosporium apiospermum]
MKTNTLILTAAAALFSQVSAEPGRTLTNWDCCKPACAWRSLLTGGVSGQVMVCNKDDQPFSNDLSNSVPSSCGDTAGSNQGYLCSDYQPRPVAENLAYGFAITDGIENCCKCYELQWTEGPAAGKRMQVQVINEGGSVTDGRREFIILTPGGGVGPNAQGCESQFGLDWGRQWGGVSQASDCESIPERMQAGCYWRWNWARGDVNTWGIDYHEISCPDALTSISGCRA